MGQRRSNSNGQKSISFWVELRTLTCLRQNRRSFSTSLCWKFNFLVSRMHHKLIISVFSLLSPFVQGQRRFYQNDLAKVCRPLDRNLDLMFVLDGSGSTGGNTFETQINMVERIVDLVDVSPNKTKIAILQYSGYTKMEFDFSEFQTKPDLKLGLQNVRHISGTTKTGKALEKAMEAFSSQYGARMDEQNVAQVAVVVSDGHSHDDPVPAAESLREMGVTLMTVGIGEYVNMNELVDIAADHELAFRNSSVDQFVEAFRKIAIGEKCEFAKGPNGVEISCNNDTIDVEILTKLPLEGHLYIPGYFGFQGCTARSLDKNPNLVALSIPLNRCGIQKQFLFDPRGLLFESSVILKFHPDYRTDTDKTFPIRCFYPDSSRFHEERDRPFKILDNNQPEHFVTSEFFQGQHKQDYSVPEVQLPCSYNLRRSYEDGCLLDNLNVGDTATHAWRCDHSVIGDNFGMLVHSCFMTDGLGKQLQILDKRGCSLDEKVLPTPTYLSYLEATSLGGVVKYADHPMMQFRCSLRFCSKRDGECDPLLPPRCRKSEAKEGSRVRRQVSPSLEFARMPPHMVERLFARRKFYQEQVEKDAIGKVQTQLVRTHAVVQDDSRKSQTDSPFTSATDTFSVDKLGVPNLQTLRPVVRIFPVRKRPILKQRSFNPSHGKEQVSAQPKSTITPTPQNEGSTVDQEQYLGSTVTYKNDEAVTTIHADIAETGVNLELIPGSVDEVGQEPATQRSHVTTEVVEESVLFDEYGMETSKLASSEYFTTESVGDTTTAEPKISTEAQLESVTLGTTPWQWVQVDGRWIRRGIHGLPEPKTVKPSQWVYINGEWIRQDYLIEADSRNEVKMFEANHRVEVQGNRAENLPVTPDPDTTEITPLVKSTEKTTVARPAESSPSILIHQVETSVKLETTESSLGREQTTIAPARLDATVAPARPELHKTSVKPGGETSATPEETETALRLETAKTSATETETSKQPEEETSFMIPTSSEPEEGETSLSYSTLETSSAGPEGAKTSARPRAADTSTARGAIETSSSEAQVDTFTTQAAEVPSSDAVSQSHLFLVDSGTVQDMDSPLTESLFTDTDDYSNSLSGEHLQIEENTPSDGVADRNSDVFDGQFSVDFWEKSPAEMDLPGLSRHILAGLQFGEVEVESQIVMVSDREEDRERGRSLVNWCSRR